MRLHLFRNFSTTEITRVNEGIYEFILLELEYEGIHTPIMIITKGTLLFRSGPERIDDFCGIVNNNDSKYVLRKYIIIGT